MSCLPTYKGKRYNSLEELYNSNGVNEKQKQQAQQLYSQYLESLNNPNTNPILKGNQQEQVKKFAELQERLNNKEFLEGAKNAFESSKGLQEWGTQEQYNDYVARVSLGIIKNPSGGEYNYTNQVRDIVYHGTDKFRGETVVEESISSSSETKSTKLTFSFKDGKTINLPFFLNVEQQSALLELEKFIKNPSLTDNQITLTGYAGTGKSSIISLFDTYLKTQYIRPAYSSPTHRANAVTKQKNPRANVFTLHSLFGLSGLINLEDGNYSLEDLKFAQQNKVKIRQGDTIIVDEASMVSDELYKFLEDAKKKYSLNIIYVGDPEQLNPVGQTSQSKVFEKGKQVKLTKVERTGDNPILRESTDLRNGKDFSYISETTPKGGIEFINTSSRISQIISENLLSDEFKNNKQYFRVLSAKKKFLPEITRIARESLFGEDNVKTQINKGEVLMGMNNFGVDYNTGEPIIINSGDYEVVEVSEGTKSVKIGMNESIKYKGFYISVKNLMEESDDLKQVFVVDTSESHINKLKFAEAISDLNIRGVKSMKAKNYKDGAMYFQMARDLEKRLAFMEDVKDMQGNLKIKSTFDYGYGMTIDKSQGGTYNKVMILADSIAYPFTKERQKQLRYVGVSRASDFVYVVHTSNKFEKNIDDEYIPYDAPYIVDDLSGTASIDDLFDDGISPESFKNC